MSPQVDNHNVASTICNVHVLVYNESRLDRAVTVDVLLHGLLVAEIIAACEYAMLGFVAWGGCAAYTANNR